MGLWWACEGKQPPTIKKAPQPPLINVQTGLCAQNCQLINKLVNDYFHQNDCSGFSFNNIRGNAGFGPCAVSRDDVERAILQTAANLQLQHDIANSPFLPWLPDGPDNGEIAARLASHFGSNPDIIAEHGFGSLSQDEIAEQIENLLNRVSQGDTSVLQKTIRGGTSRVYYDPASGCYAPVTGCLSDSYGDRWPGLRVMRRSSAGVTP